MDIKSKKKQVRKIIESYLILRLLFYFPLFIYRTIKIFIIKKIIECYFSYRYYNSKRLFKMNDLTIGIKKLGEKKVVFPHPIGIVIGIGVQIGEKCTVYQNVTIGSKTQEDADQLKYPKIGNHVIIGSHAVIIGDITIGDNVIIGASTFVNHNIPDNSTVVGNPCKIILNKRKT